MALQKFPGFIDIHVHLREPGVSHKEDFKTGARAAVKGGFTFICDMPNNPGHPTVSIRRLEEKITLSTQKSVCDIGFHYGTDGNNLNSFHEAAKNNHVFGLKIYAGKTTGDLLVGDNDVEKIMSAWQSEKPILVHAEGERLRVCVEIAHRLSRRIHVCHVASVGDIDIIRKARARSQFVTAGVTPHHLILTEEEVMVMGQNALIKPFIGDNRAREALWEALLDGTIDLIETDHSPHTMEEKAANPPVYGFPGLETAIGLVARALKEKKLSTRYLVTWFYENPKKIFHIPDQENTYIELDPEQSFVAGVDGYETKCGWSPFDGWELYGKVQRVILRGRRIL